MFTIANNRRTVLTFGASNGSESRIAHRFRGQNGAVGMVTTRRIGVGIALALAVGAIAAPASARTFSYSSTGSMVQQPPPTGVALSDGSRTRSVAAAGAGYGYGVTPTLSTASVPPILPTVKASQLARFEQAGRQAVAYAPPNGRAYSDAETNAYKTAATPGVVAVATSPVAFDWGDAGIGAAAGFALAILGLGAALVISRRQRRGHRTTALPS